MMDNYNEYILTMVVFDIEENNNNDNNNNDSDNDDDLDDYVDSDD